MGDVESRPRFFYRNRRWNEGTYERFASVASSVSECQIEIPSECVNDWNFVKLINSGMCSFKELKDGTYSMKDVWQMLDLLELDDYVKNSGALIAQERAEENR